MGTGRPMIAWRKVVQQYGCMKCGASPGMPCRTDHGNRRYEPHMDRTYLASRDGWRDLSDERSPVNRT